MPGVFDVLAFWALRKPVYHPLISDFLNAGSKAVPQAHFFTST